MGAIIEALVPVFLIIVLGAGLRRVRIFDDPVWRGVENLCYYLLFPVLLVKTLAVAELGGASVLRFAAALLFA
ncbi:MAG TPA: AEC family transporter, partial [Sedimenticola sp.]|nr:AEC family transporter [Sedimenticola sp.]